MRIVVLGSQPEYLTGLRGPMIREFLAAGHAVTAIGADDVTRVRADLEAWGASYEVVPIRRAGINPFADLRAIVALYLTLRRLKPDLLFAYTVKPIVYGLPVSWLAGVRQRFAMVAGRGFALLPGNEKRRRLARFLTMATYRFSLRFADGVLFHNDDDRELFRTQRLVNPSTPTMRIYGSGVDLDHYRPAPFPDSPVAFLMISRLIADKGVREYVEAARQLKRLHPDAIFRLVGPADPSPNGISATEVSALASEGVVEYLGPLSDVRPAIANAHVYVLPSYCEGLPRSVLEAMAMRRPIVTTDAPGCRDTVMPGRNGYLARVKDAASLAAALERFIQAPESIEPMGEAALSFAQDRYDVRKVNRSIAEFLGLRNPNQPDCSPTDSPATISST
jgi:glycosyltransferase involved in cell wall biosynthesis